MKRITLGELEELVLLITASLEGDAYGVTITHEIEMQSGRSIGFNTVHTTLQRLEEKGFIVSEMGGASAERGGRRKRYFKLTPLGIKAIGQVRALREKIWQSLPSKFLGLAGN